MNRKSTGGSGKLIKAVYVPMIICYVQGSQVG